MVNKILETYITNMVFGDLFVGHDLDIDSILEVFLSLKRSFSKSLFPTICFLVLKSLYVPTKAKRNSNTR